MPLSVSTPSISSSICSKQDDGMLLSVSTPSDTSSICSKQDDDMSFLTASDFEDHQNIEIEDDDNASFITAASSDYKSTGSIVFELPDEDTQPTATNVYSLSVIPTENNEESIRFYFEPQGTQPTVKHVYSSFITPDTNENNASIRLYIDNTEDIDDRCHSKLTEPVEPQTTMFYNPSAVQDTFDEDKFSKHSIDEILNLHSYEDITGQNTKRTYAKTLSADAQEYYDLLEAYSDDPILFPPKSNSLTSLAFRTHCDLTPEEQDMPLFLLPKENNFIAAYRGQLHHRLNARKQKPEIFCPFLGF